MGRNDKQVNFLQKKLDEQQKYYVKLQHHKKKYNGNLFDA